MQKGVISVIIPIYKVEPYLNRCVESVVGQTYKNLEIILVDDGSPDLCPQICDEWAKKDDRIRVIHKPNGGLSDARNSGIDICTGEYICFVDSDDYIAPQMYEKMLLKMQEDGSDMAICGINEFCDGETPSVKEGESELIDSNMALHRLCDKKYNIYFVVAWNKLYKRYIFDNLRYPVGKIHEDEFLAHRVIGECKKISCMPEKYYFYYIRQGSITNSGFKEKQLAKIEAMEDRMEYVRLNFPEVWNDTKKRTLNTISAMYCKAKMGHASKDILKSLKQKYNSVFKRTKDKNLKHYLFRYCTWVYYILFKMKTHQGGKK